MSSIYIEGGFPLEGDIKPSGSKDSALKLLSASTLSNEEIVLENISKTQEVNLLIEIINSLGGNVSWVGKNKLTVSGAEINNYVIPFELGSRLRLASLLAGPILFRFGKAVIPKPLKVGLRPLPMNRWIDTWTALGVNVEQDEENFILNSEEITGANINFKISTHNGTANAILSSVFARGETYINNAAEESEIDDLVSLFKLMGCEIDRIEPRKIKIVGTNVFRGGYFNAQVDKVETVALASAALVTKGNITIRGISSLNIASFLNFLTKIGARYEYDTENLNVWYGGEKFNSVKQATAPSPGFLADWVPYATLLLNYAQGESFIHDTIYVDKFGYTQDLNRMGADIELMRPSGTGFQTIISDESYDYGSQGEPKTVAKITGPSKLRGARFNTDDPRFDAMLIIAALSAEGKSELIGVDNMFIRYEDFFDKLSNLGAKLSQ